MRQQLLAIVALSLLFSACGKDNRSATELLRETMDPRAGAFVVEAQRAYERGAYAMALDFTDSAEVYAPDLADLHYIRALVYSDMNNPTIATLAYERVLELDPMYPGAYFGLGLSAFRGGDMREAALLYFKELEIQESSAAYTELGRTYSKLAVVDTAEAAYLDAIRVDSTNSTAIMWLGQLYEEVGELDKALSWSRIGVELQPNNMIYRYILGSQLQRSGDSEAALEVLLPVAEAKPWHQGAQINTAQALMALGRGEEARPYFIRADSAQQHQQRVNEADAEAKSAPDSLQKWITLADLYRKSSDFDLAVQAYKVAVSLDPWNMYLQANLAMLMAESGDFNSAIRRYRAIVNTDSTLTDVWTNLGVAYAEVERQDLARAAWEVVLRQKPNDQRAREYIRQLDTQANSDG